ncbi:MAG: HD domain-containing protein [Desulfobacterales bacterium]
MNSLWSQEIYIKALHFAALAHQGQKYPGTDLPYLLHADMVCMEIMAALHTETDADGNLAVQCALLHDVIEDTGTSASVLREEFGDAVTDGVLALSKNPHLEKSLQLADSLERIRKQPREIWMVKMADRISNLSAPPHYWTCEKISDYRKEAVTIYDALKEASLFLSQRLKHRIAQYQKFVAASGR